MAEMISGSQPDTNGIPAYSDSWEHISDELARLDLLLLQQVQHQSPRRHANPLEPFQGFVLSEEEVSYLLRTKKSNLPQGDPSSRVHEQQELADALNQIGTRIRKRLEASAAKNVYLALPVLSQIFRLNQFEERCLLVCLAPEKIGRAHV